LTAFAARRATLRPAKEKFMLLLSDSGFVRWLQAIETEPDWIGYGVAGESGSHRISHQ